MQKRYVPVYITIKRNPWEPTEPSRTEGQSKAQCNCGGCLHREPAIWTLAVRGWSSRKDSDCHRQGFQFGGLNDWWAWGISSRWWSASRQFV